MCGSPFSDESDGLQIICECTHVFQVGADHDHPKLLRLGRKNTALRFRIAVVLDPLNKLQASVLAVLLADISKCIVHDYSFMIDSLVIKGHVRFASRQNIRAHARGIGSYMISFGNTLVGIVRIGRSVPLILGTLE